MEEGKSKIVEAAMRLMDSVNEAYGDSANVTDVIIVATVDTGQHIATRVASSDGVAGHVGIGMLTIALDHMRGMRR